MNPILHPKRGRPKKDRRRYIQIAAAVDYRGTDDSQLFFLFRDPPRSLLRQVFKGLIADGKGIASRAVVSEEHDIVRRSGKGYWRKAVEMVNPNFEFCSLDSMKMLIESCLRRIHPCNVRWMPIDKFLNV